MILAMPRTRCHPTIRELARQAAAAARRRGLWFGLPFVFATLTLAPAFAQSPEGSVAQPSREALTATQQTDKTRARIAFQAGRRAEQAGDWKAEFAAYTEAAQYDSANREYSVLKEHARFQVIQSLVENAERQEIAGDTPAARALLTQALEIDPNYVVARERLDELAPAPPATGAQSGPRLAGLPRLTLKPGKHAFDFRGTVRGAYGEIGNQFGVKVVFDADLPDRAVRFQVPALDFDTAVMVLSRQTRTFTRVVDAHTMFVTEDSPQKVRDYALEVERELLLPASVGSDEMNEVVRMIREMTGITRTQLNTATRTLSVRSTEQNVALAEALLKQIEQPHGELMLEIEILEVDRTTGTQLGVTPPASSSLFMLTLPEVRQLQAAQNSGTLIQTLQSIFGSSAISSASGASLPALIVFGGGKTIFLATMPDFSANFGSALSTVLSAQRILLRSQDGKPATFFVGDRYPISLGLLSSDLSPASSAIAAALTSALASGLTLPRTDYDVGKTPVSVALAVFNNKDNFFDAAVANQGDGTISILQGNGDGTFTIPTTPCAPITPATLTTQPFPSCIQLPPVVSGASLAKPSAIATGDFDGDGNTDIAVTDGANKQVWILFGNGDGTFQPPVAYATGSNPVALVAQDFDGDGHPDLAIVNHDDNTVSVLLGKIVNTAQRVTFAPSPNQPNPISVGSSPSAIATGIFITNKFPSLAITNQGDNTVSILLGNGTNGIQDGTFTPVTPPTLATGNSPAGIAVADFDNDGNQDLAVTYSADTSGNSLAVFFGRGDGTFEASRNFPAGSGPVGIVAAAFAGTNSSLAVADETGDNVDVLVGNGDRTFLAPISLPTGNSPVALATADLNGDGTLDLVTANKNGAPVVANAPANTVTVTLNTLQSSANSASSQNAYPSAEYEDLGLKVKATPHMHADNEVTLQLEFDIKSLTGSNINGIPILSNRNIEQTIRLRENETSVLSGILQSNELRSTSGLPWISTEPGIGLLTGEDAANIQKTELLILVTPRAFRLPAREGPAIYAGRGEPSTPPSAPAPPGGPLPGPAGAPNQNRPPERGGFGGGTPPNQGPGPVVPPQQPPAQQPEQPERLPPQQQ